MKLMVKETKTYKFAELTDEQKEKAIENLWDINVDGGFWCEYYMEDNEDTGIKVTAFDIDRGSYCDLKFTDYMPEVATKIISNHGENCNTWTTANNFLTDYNKLNKELENKNTTDDRVYELEGLIEDREKEFEKELSEDYLSLLRKDYEYQTSEKGIIETIEANDYNFTIDGKIY